MSGVCKAGQDCTKPKGQIQVIFGPMFSGKTTELLRRVRRYEIAKHRCLVVKHAKDQRYSQSGICTHDMLSVDAISTLTLAPMKAIAGNYTVLGIDEGQFFPDIVEFCEDMAQSGKTVIVAALDGTFERKGFNDILGLVPLAEHVVKLSAVCMLCFSDASYTKRLGCETAVEIVGGAERYMAVCRKCYSASNNHPDKPIELKEEVAA